VISGGCITHENDEKCIKKTLSETLKGRNDPENLGIGGRIIYKNGA
jgi:hypothetical protein